MIYYSSDLKAPSKPIQIQVIDPGVHFKSIRETAQAIKGVRS